MKKRTVIIQTCIIALCIAMTITGCGKKQEVQSTPSSADNAAQTAQTSSPDYTFQRTEAGGTPEEAQDNGSAEGSTSSITSSAGIGINGIMGDRKIIFNAFISLEVEEFDTTYKKIISIVQNSGTGYMESSNSQSIKIASNPDRYKREGTIVIRVAQDQFNNVLDEIKSMGTVLDERVDSKNITGEYYDTTYRTKMYEAERDRIMEYLKEAKDLDTMLKLERKLSEVTYEIERLKGTLRNWDNLVEFSTITIEIKEKVPEEIAKKQSSTYGQKMLNALIDSSTATIRAVGDVIILLVSLIPVLIILGILYLILRPVIKKFLKKNDKNTDKNVES
ncbi:MAG: DUF4349 domain-containing protein [Clostridiaceae bacterium]|nr:DUF4349 domain-containing protein [Clostridiaceae bacterium]